MNNLGGSTHREEVALEWTDDIVESLQDHFTSIENNCATTFSNTVAAGKVLASADPQQSYMKQPQPNNGEGGRSLGSGLNTHLQGMSDDTKSPELTLLEISNICDMMALKADELNVMVSRREKRLEELHRLRALDAERRSRPIPRGRRGLELQRSLQPEGSPRSHA